MDKPAIRTLSNSSTNVRDLIVPGRNIVAVHCKRRVTTRGGAMSTSDCMRRRSVPRFDERRWATLQISDPMTKLAAAYQIRGDQRAIDQLVERRPKLAGPDRRPVHPGDKKDWQRAIELYSKGITAKTTDVDLLSKRARAYEALKNWDAAAADWSRAASGNPDGAKLLAEFARRLAAGGQVPLARLSLKSPKHFTNDRWQADPENDLVAAELAQLLLDKEENESRTRWTVLKPSEMKSKGGATLSKLPDESILASGRTVGGSLPCRVDARERHQPQGHASGGTDA